jgi:hypothetical protein
MRKFKKGVLNPLDGTEKIKEKGNEHGGVIFFILKIRLCINIIYQLFLLLMLMFQVKNITYINLLLIVTKFQLIIYQHYTLGKK